ncbi:hypothetical protein BJF79_05235 [Actinomadura sp. CNU-125]|uniref:peptidoglycan-binding protein n=1 Tax=Actinomadura sp. CNU-125 TaxID=1904961 RepID=UPI0009673AC1|nr:peptidoglycan-binding protein [Actinomadura sp. CNU-125]OLT10116.1 hypothetical protein BJF79_05235 [Actinomadura sp. CNU-125]
MQAADGGETRAGRTAAPATAPVVRGDLVDTETVDGTLTYADVTSVWTGASGVVTWAPEQGAAIGRGETLLRVDGRPVTLMYGTAPMYRKLAQGAEGKDVRMLEENLKALGHGSDMTVDGEFTAATGAAVRDWQDERGLPETGTVDAAQVVFLGGAARVREVKAPEGGRTAQGKPVLSVSGTERMVHVDLDADRQDLARKGAKAAVELPGGTRVEGTIAEVGAVAESHGEDTTVDVEIAVEYDGRFDEAPVRVELAGERRADVLSVPVEALLAVPGGFGVEVVEGARTRVVPVTAGAFGGGRVEVSGGGLRAGTKVGVPAE